jgi:2-polyprenyl-3-methyl-5-hydroxy-6-metoxy-1,4-benzoquinol methylase
VIKVPDFDALYGANPDPWAVSSSFYERRKLDLVMGVLSRPHYAHAWDPACGTGHGAERLADRTEQVLATDASATAMQITRRTCAGRPNVTVEQRSLPSPARAAETFDLVVLGEFLYYLVEADRSATYDLLQAVAAPTAEVVAVHWRHHPHDAWLSGAAVQAELVSALTSRGWHLEVQLEDPDFVLHTLRRGAARHA